MLHVGWLVIVCALGALALGACGGRAPLPDGCLDARASDVLRALRQAPRHVALQDGSSLSTCVERAVDDADLQVVGATLTSAADVLARRLKTSDRAALELGFLMGAVARGAHTTGVQSELSARIGQAAGFDGGPRERRATLLRGRTAGRHNG